MFYGNQGCAKGGRPGATSNHLTVGFSWEIGGPEFENGRLLETLLPFFSFTQIS